ncbi:MAG: inositol monophosphatase family protein [Melioribacteraceae bacterium]|nr:inositol monophosphatase family protein [Melioribacteraceae bacterium]
MLNNVIEIAKDAGSLIRSGFREQISIEFKTNESNLVTNIDKLAEDTIKNRINAEYPTHSIIAEESEPTKNSSQYTWIIDPIDGTTNFAHGLPIFSVSIGVQKGDEIIYGVIYDVMREVVYYAEKGSGAFENDKRIYVGNNPELSKSVLVTGFAYDRSDDYREAVNIFGAFLSKTRAVRRLGSAAIDFCYVASGVFDGFWEANLSPWDVCAGILIVNEAGGIVTDYNKNPANPFSRNFIASNDHIHDSMIDLINDNRLNSNKV